MSSVLVVMFEIVDCSETRVEIQKTITDAASRPGTTIAYFNTLHPGVWCFPYSSGKSTGEYQRLRELPAFYNSYKSVLIGIAECRVKGAIMFHESVWTRDAAEYHWAIQSVASIRDVVHDPSSVIDNKNSVSVVIDQEAGGMTEICREWLLASKVPSFCDVLNLSAQEFTHKKPAVRSPLHMAGVLQSIGKNLHNPAFAQDLGELSRNGRFVGL